MRILPRTSLARGCVMSCSPRARSCWIVVAELSMTEIGNATISSFGSLHGVPVEFCFQQSYKAITSGRNLDSRSACSLSAGFVGLVGRVAAPSTATDIAAPDDGGAGGGTANFGMPTGAALLVRAPVIPLIRPEKPDTSALLVDI